MKHCRLLCALLASPIAALPAAALELTANAGYMSDYIFRGVPQVDSAAMAGLDAAAAGFYLGAWAADVEPGLEIDLYGGYEGTLGDIRYGVGATGYFYTDDFDDDYREVNTSLGWRLFSIDADFGRYDNFGGPTLDYSHIAPKVEYRGFHALYGTFGGDFDGSYWEAGYGATFEPLGIDYTMAVIRSSARLLGTGSGDASLVLSVSKTFTLR